MRQILINVEPYEKRVAITRRDTLEEFHIERRDQPRLAGNIYKGLIQSIVPGIGALFLDIGTGKNGFLYIKDIEGKSAESLLDEEIVPVGEERGHDVRRKRPGLARERLKKGQEVLIQVTKEPIGTKGPLLTTDISLPGKYLVLMPFNNTIGVSKRIEDVGERAKLKEILGTLNLPKGIGCIARTESVGIGPRPLKLELRYLMNLWARIQYRSTKQKAPALIYEEYDLPLRMIRDYFYGDIEKILVDSKEEYKKIIRFTNAIQPKLKRKIFYYRGKTPLYERYGIEKEIEGVFRRKIFLKSGGSIVIEATEGLVAIDVNTGKFTGKKRPGETIFRTNMEAASEIARQIMLRDMGGIIVIDFIDMDEKAHRNEVYKTLESAFKKDKAKINILPISRIGLVEMTRQRTRKSLESVSFRDCPYCNGMGRVKTPATIAIETIRKLQRLLRERGSREILLTLHPDVSESLKSTSFKNILRFLERKFRKRVTIRSDSKLHLEDVHFE